MAAWNVPAHGFPNSTSPGFFSFFSMLDPKLIRETPELVRAALAKKHLSVDLDAVLAAIGNAEINRRLIDLGYVVVGDQPEEFATFMKNDLESLRKSFRTTRVSID